MLANQWFVREAVKQATWEFLSKEQRDIWIRYNIQRVNYYMDLDKNPNYRRLGFLFQDKELADRVADELKNRLTLLGYNNPVVRTTAQQEYIRVLVAFEKK